MKRFLVVMLVTLWACTKTDPIILGGSEGPVDTGVYSADPAKSDAYCDLKLLDNPNCWDSELRVYQDCHYNLLFTRYDNGWTGADATYSVPLPDGRILWMFGDTFIGSVQADRRRGSSTLVRNTFLLQQGDEMKTMVGGTSGDPKPLVVPIEEDEWYWPGDATVFENELQWMVLRLGNVGAPGMWSFAYTGFDLAIFSLPDLELVEIVRLPLDETKSYGAAILEDGAYTYLYGISNAPFRKRAHVARVSGGDLRGSWQFFNGDAWQNAPSDHIISEGVSDQFSVFKDGEIYYLVTQEIIFGDQIFISQATRPEGPFTGRRVLYCTPETGGNIFTYNAFVHPELSQEGELRISYNINSFDFNDILEDADLYRPYFIAVENWK